MKNVYLSVETQPHAKRRFVCLCWIGQIFRHFSQPKESYIADWEQLPVWQQETDANIFEAIASEED